MMVCVIIKQQHGDRACFLSSGFMAVTDLLLVLGIWNTVSRKGKIRNTIIICGEVSFRRY